MVGSRHSSLRLPSTTVRASAAPRCPWAGVTTPAGQPNSQASTSGVTSRGTDQPCSARAVDGRTRPSRHSTGAVDGPRTPPRRSATLPVRGPSSGGAGSFVRPVANPVGSSLPGAFARRMVSLTRSASGHAAGVGGPVGSAERMRTSFAVGPGAWRPCGSRVDAGRSQGSRTGPGGRLASARGRSRAPGPGTRAGPLQPRGEAGVAALGGVPVRHGKPGGCPHRRRLSSRQAGGGHLYRIATIPCCSGCQINQGEGGDSVMVWPPLVPASP
jgi:hypothetical protein